MGVLDSYKATKPEMPTHVMAYATDDVMDAENSSGSNN